MLGGIVPHLGSCCHAIGFLRRSAPSRFVSLLNGNRKRCEGRTDPWGKKTGLAGLPVSPVPFELLAYWAGFAAALWW
jgi:hypothetical protein